MSDPRTVLEGVDFDDLYNDRERMKAKLRDLEARLAEAQRWAADTEVALCAHSDPTVPTRLISEHFTDGPHYDGWPSKVEPRVAALLDVERAAREEHADEMAEDGAMEGLCEVCTALSRLDSARGSSHE